MTFEDLKFGLFMAFGALVAVGYVVTKVRPHVDLYRSGEPRRATWRTRRPAWVKVGLSHVGSRQTAVNFARFSLIAAFAWAIPAAYIAFSHPFAFLPSVLLLVAAGWYRLCVRWVDRHDAWPDGT